MLLRFQARHTPGEALATLDSDVDVLRHHLIPWQLRLVISAAMMVVPKPRAI
jgi:hypothetical protein